MTATERRGRDHQGQRAVPAPLASVAEADPEWCTAALAAELGDTRVLDVAAEAIGAGQMADTFRLHLTYDRQHVGARSYVLKLAARSPRSRSAAKAMGSYLVEASFYRDLAPTLPVRSPRCHVAHHDAASQDLTLLLEDVDGVVGDQLVGCEGVVAERAIGQLADLQGPRWGDPGLASLSWLPRSTGAEAGRVASLVRAVFPRFTHVFADRVDAEVWRLVEQFVPRVEAYLHTRPGPRTVVHGDFRADNLVVGRDGVTVLDWQTAGIEPGPTDLSYFLGGSLDTEVRRRTERDLVECYRAALGRHGVHLGADACWADYRRYSLGGVLMCVLGSSLVTLDERGTELFTVMTTRHSRHALDLESLALLP